MSDKSEQGLLGAILVSTRAELERRKRELPPQALAELLAAQEQERARKRRSPGAFHAALLGDGLALIAEIKRRAPSAGTLRGELDVAALARAYCAHGASAISVLTEGPHFGGSLDDLRSAREACAAPLLRKDFIVDPYQLLEARLAGADAVLLIVGALDDRQLVALLEQARSLGLDALVEVHDRAELERALAADAQIIGVNNRDLRDFSVDLRRTLDLLPAVGSGPLIVSESGISSAEQLLELAQAGVHAALIGTSLMRCTDPARALAMLREALVAAPQALRSPAGGG
jgi:indole-3-glycerol phosphate synthase